MSNIRLMHGDSLAAMRGMKDKSYELAIVDPEYGINAGNMVMGKGVSSKIAKHNWDNHPATQEYFDELFRVSKNQIIFGGNYFSLPITNAWIVWDKDRQKDISFSDGELIWTSFDFNLKIHKHKYDGFLGADKDCRIHKCQKPIKLYQWLLKNYAKSGDHILDTHAGSFSLGIACDIMGYDIDAWEIDLEYYTAAKARLARHQQQATLFTADGLHLNGG